MTVELERLRKYAKKVAAESKRPKEILSTGVAVHVLAGWKLWRQQMSTRLVIGDLQKRNPILDESNEVELWLRDDGSLWYASVDTSYHVVDSRAERSASASVASEQQLRMPDYRWHRYDHKPDRRFAFDNEAHWNQGAERFDKPFLGLSIALNGLTK